MLREALCQAAPSSEEVLKECGAWIHRAARRICDRMPWADIDELVQQGVLAALEQRERYTRGRGVPFLAFVKPRVFGAMIDMMRAAGTASRAAAVLSQLGMDEEHASALDLMIRQEDREGLASAIADLEQDERTILALFYLEELTNKEAATVMAISESKATRLRQRAIQRLAGAVLSAPGGTA